jgi:hypothetical protein
MTLVCAACTSSAPGATVARAPTPRVHFDEPRDERPDSALLAHSAAPTAAPKPPPATVYPPEVVHEARIELAREALEADNHAKVEIEELEQMQRDVAKAEADGETAAGRRQKR